MGSEKKISEQFSITGEATVLDALNQHDVIADGLNKSVVDIIKDRLPALKEKRPNIDWENIFGLVQNADGVTRAEDENFKKQFIKEDGTPDAEKMRAYADLQDVAVTVHAYSSVIAERQFETDQKKAQKDLKRAIQDMKKAGYSFKDVVKFFDEVKISKSFTVHPTEHHSEEGIELDRALIAAAELPAGEREAAMNAVIGKMIENPIGTTRKNSIQDEAESSNKWARIHNEGVSNLERFIGDVIEEEYGKRPEIQLDAAPRSWDYDSDGKNNAEGWAMMAKMATTTMGSFDDTLEALYKVPKDVKPKLVARTIDRIEKARARLEPIFKRARHVVQKLAEFPTPEERQEYYATHYEEFQKLSEEFSHVYDDTDPKDRGLHTWDDTLTDLNKLRKTLGKDRTQEAFIPIDNAFRNLRRTGFALEKGQTRQNDLIHAKIIDNFFNSDKFKAHNILNEQDFAEINAAGGLSGLKTARKYEIFNKVIEFSKKNGNRQDLLKDLFDANPLEYSSNGYPEQTRTLLDRFVLRSHYPKKFDQGIISDATEAALTHQKFLADMFGMDKMRHMPLFEDRSTLSRLSSLVEIFNDFGGEDGIELRRALSRISKMFDKHNTGREIHDLSMMVPCSDSTRGAGSAALMEIVHETRKIVRTIVKLSDKLSTKQQKAVAAGIEFMIGGGMSMGRFGADVGFMRRVIEQELKEIAKENNFNYDRQNKVHRRLMRSSSAILYTEQGRSKRFFTATSNQVMDDFSRRVSEMIRGRMDLEGLVPDNTYIPAPYKFSNPKMEEIAIDAWKLAIDSYIKNRFIESEHSDELILNNVADETTCPNIIALLNNGARPLAKSGKKVMTTVRAIENDKRNNLSQLFTSGTGMGAVLLFLEDKLVKGEISEEDVLELFEHPEWDYLMFTKEVANAERTDYNYAKRKLGLEKYSDKELADIGNKIKVRPERERGADGKVILVDRFDTSALSVKFTENQLYLARLVADHENFLGTMKKFTDIEKQFPAAMQIVREHQKVKPMLNLMHFVEDYIASFPEDERADAKKRLGGDGFIRALGSAYNAGTASHYPLWSGAKNCYLQNVPQQSFESLLKAGKTQAKKKGRFVAFSDFGADQGPIIEFED